MFLLLLFQPVFLLFAFAFCLSHLSSLLLLSCLRYAQQKMGEERMESSLRALVVFFVISFYFLNSLLPTRMACTRKMEEREQEGSKRIGRARGKRGRGVG